MRVEGRNVHDPARVSPRVAGEPRRDPQTPIAVSETPAPTPRFGQTVRWRAATSEAPELATRP